MIDAMEFDRNGLEVLDRTECLRLLASATLGRIAVSSGALPVILPVNFLLDGDQVLIRTSPGSKLEMAAKNAVVAFEVDHVDAFSHTGWSVSVTGTAREVTDAADLARIRALPLAYWAPAPAQDVIRVSTDLVSGRRIRENRRAGSPA